MNSSGYICHTIPEKVTYIELLGSWCHILVYFSLLYSCWTHHILEEQHLVPCEPLSVSALDFHLLVFDHSVSMYNDWLGFLSLIHNQLCKFCSLTRCCYWCVKMAVLEDLQGFISVIYIIYSSKRCHNVGYKEVTYSRLLLCLWILPFQGCLAMQSDEPHIKDFPGPGFYEPSQ